MQVLVLADTHVRPDRRRVLPAAVLDAADRADLVLHAGDIVTAGVLDTLAARAPVHAVLGNNDRTLVGELPETVELTVGGVDVAMIHDSGPAKGTAARLRRRFPIARLVVFGHSHLPLDELGDGEQRLFNPGSCTERRRAAHHTYGWLDLRDGTIARHRIVSID